MYHYLFTNDLRISVLDESLKKAGQCFATNTVPPSSVDKSANNNMMTLGFYFTLNENSNCAKAAAAGNTRAVVLNFIKKFQFPNMRTNVAFNECKDDGIKLAPMRVIVKVDFQSAPARRLAGISDGLRKRGVTMLAEKVESYQEAEWAGNAGYELLQGFYFQRPELISAKRLTPDAHTKLRILYYLASGRMERKELFALLSYSPQLAFRLLNFVNSVAFSFREKIDSIKQAIVLMGVDRLRRWLSAMLIADQSHTSDTARELSILCVFRAHFLRDIAASSGSPYAEQLFALGLFSTLDAMHRTSFENLFERAFLNEAVKKALISQEGDFYPWLKAVLCLETGNIDEAARLFAALGVFDLREIVKKYRTAMTLASTFHTFAETL